MKKTVILIMVLVGLVTTLYISFPNEDWVVDFGAMTHEMEWNIEFPITISEDINYSDIRREMVAELSFLPKNIEKEFADSRMVIVVEPWEEVNYAGWINHYRNKIMIFDTCIKWATLHEIGHWYDNKYGFSDEDRFVRLFNLHSNILSDYYQSPAEFFAETFKLFCHGELDNVDLIWYYNSIIYGR